MPICLLLVLAYGVWKYPAFSHRGWKHYAPTTLLILLYPQIDQGASGQVAPEQLAWHELYSRNYWHRTWAWQRRWIAERAGPGLDQANNRNQRIDALMLLFSCGADAMSQLDRIIELTVDRDQTIRYYAHWQLSRLCAGSPDVWKLVQSLLRDPSGDVEEEGRLQGLPVSDLPIQEVLPLLTELLAGENPARSLGAARCLGALGPAARDALPALERARVIREADDPWLVVDAAIAQIRGEADSAFDYRLRVVEETICPERSTGTSMFSNGWLAGWDPQDDPDRYLNRAVKLVCKRPDDLRVAGLWQMISYSRERPAWALRDLRKLAEQPGLISWVRGAVEEVIVEWTLP
ncbi:MAG TPA: hypothetical protein VG797_07280 [Phycisphaerales bacterium]|nr:hypothetical protein [Phycisphaerales bacterium]